jgi:hypothetical protein
MSHNPCHHQCDWTDGDTPEFEDAGCCTPLPIRRDCAAPVLPTPECDEEDPEVVYDPETEGFVVLSVLYDENCSPILDQDDDEILTQMG